MVVPSYDYSSAIITCFLAAQLIATKRAQWYNDTEAYDRFKPIPTSTFNWSMRRLLFWCDFYH
jgi:hypothetical protein